MALLGSVLTCPSCGVQATETMPEDACQYFPSLSQRSDRHVDIVWSRSEAESSGRSDPLGIAIGQPPAGWPARERVDQ